MGKKKGQATASNVQTSTPTVHSMALQPVQPAQQLVFDVVLRAEYDKLKEENRQLRDSLKDKNTIITERDLFAKTVEDLKKENSDLKVLIAKLEVENVALQADNKNLHSSVADLSVKVEHLTVENTNLKARLDRKDIIKLKTSMIGAWVDINRELSIYKPEENKNIRTTRNSTIHYIDNAGGLTPDELNYRYHKFLSVWQTAPDSVKKFYINQLPDGNQRFIARLEAYVNSHPYNLSEDEKDYIDSYWEV